MDLVLFGGGGYVLLALQIWQRQRVRHKSFLAVFAVEDLADAVFEGVALFVNFWKLLSREGLQLFGGGSSSIVSLRGFIGVWRWSGFINLGGGSSSIVCGRGFIGGGSINFGHGSNFGSVIFKRLGVKCNSIFPSC